MDVLMRGDICVQLKATLDLKLTFILDGYTGHIQNNVRNLQTIIHRQDKENTDTSHIASHRSMYLIIIM